MYNAQLFFAFVVTSIRLTEDEYRVNEDGDTVEVCVERIGQTTEDITVSLNSEETSPASAAGKGVLVQGISQRYAG